MFKNNPFIPPKKANLVIVDGRIDKKSMNTLEKLGLKVILTPKCNEVYDAISYHPDIVIHPLNYNTLVVAPNVFEYFEDKFYGTNIKLIKGEKILGSKYPDNIAYNVGRVNGAAIHNFKYTDEVLLHYLKKQGLDFIQVKQGYSKCSIAIVDEKAIITSDYGIYKKLINYDIDILLVEPGYVKLEGFEYGFIGGTCGSFSKNDIIFSGDFNSHPNSEEIVKFLRKYHKNAIFMNQKTMVDLGTIISLYCN